MMENIPIASYAELHRRRLNTIQTLTRSLRESQTALLSRDVEVTAEFTRQQAELCNEIEYLDRDIASANEIIAWAKALQPNTSEIESFKRHEDAAQRELRQCCRVHGALVRRAKRSLTVMMNARSTADCFASPSSYQAMQISEEA